MVEHATSEMQRSTPVRVLLVEDAAADARLVQEMLVEAGGEGGFSVVLATTAAEMSRQLDIGRFDVALLDLSLPDAHALEVLQRAQRGPQPLPTVILTGVADEGIALEAARKGADEYLVKGTFAPELLARAMRQAIARHAKALELARAHRRADFLATHDVLTGLPNRYLLRDRVGRAVAAARRLRHGVAVLYLDLDGFKQANDRYGHSVGDHLLTVVAERLRARLRESDTAARVGGDEFVVLLAPVTDARAALQVARMISTSLAAPVHCDAGALEVSASIGIAVYPNDAEEVDELVRRADHAMYAAKSRGRGHCVTFGQRGGEAGAVSAAIDLELEAAVATDAIVVRYDPRVVARTGRVEAVAARLSWRRPNGRALPPALLLDLLQERGHLPRFSRLLFETAARDVARWRATIRPDLRLVLETSTAQYRDPAFVPALTQALEAAALDPTHVDVEVSQATLAPATDEATEVERSLNEMGVHLFLAELGAGELSLARFTGHSLHGFRIARELIDAVVQDPHRAAMTRALLELARALDLVAVAAGVATTAQVEFLRSHGCEWMEGPLFGAQLTVEAMVERLAVAGRSTV